MFNKKKYIIIFISTIILLISAFLFSGNSSNPLEIVNPAPQRQVTFGAWTEGFFDASTQTLHPEKLIEFENLIGKKASIAHYYIGWEALDDPRLIAQFKIINDNNWQPMLNVNPYYFDDCPPTNLPIYKAIASGHCDAFLHQAGKNLNKVDRPFYLLFAWEMNNKDLEWSIPYSGSSPEDFILAWRHIHDIFEKENAKNIIWVFCPNVPNVQNLPYNSFYPGDEYVDWIGLDGYNWGTTQSWSSWTEFRGVFQSSYDLIISIAPDKPLMLAEVNTTDRGGDKAQWYRDMFTIQIPNNFPKISAVIIFNEDRTPSENVNWKIDVSQESLDVFKSAVNSPLYQ